MSEKSPGLLRVALQMPKHRMEENSFWVGVGICEKTNPLGPQGDSEDEFTVQTHADRQSYWGLWQSALSALMQNLQNEHSFSFHLLVPYTHHPVCHQAKRDGRAGEDKDWKNTIQPESFKKSNLEDKQHSIIN